MLDLYISIFTLYFFTLGGFIIKKIYDKKIDKKTLTLIVIYFLQPILGFWGFVKAPINIEIFYSGVLYFLVIFLVMLFLLPITKLFVKNKKIRIITTITGTIGNTGNLGIPLAGIIFGPIGIVISTMINFFNILWVFIFGTYFYSSGKYNIKRSIYEIIKMPIIWASTFGILLNIYGINIGESNFMKILDMGAYSAIVTQLFLLGIFFSAIKIKNFDFKLNLSVSSIKFILLPISGFLVLYLYKNIFGKLDQVIYGVILLQLFTPLAINNVNLANIYNCYDNKVSELILTSNIIFLIFFPILFGILI